MPTSPILRIPSVYTPACKGLGLEPGQCAMVAARLGDLEAARMCESQNIYIERGLEESWPTEKIDGAGEPKVGRHVGEDR